MCSLFNLRVCDRSLSADPGEGRDYCLREMDWSLAFSASRMGPTTTNDIVRRHGAHDAEITAHTRRSAST